MKESQFHFAKSRLGQFCRSSPLKGAPYNRDPSSFLQADRFVSCFASECSEMGICLDWNLLYEMPKGK